MLNPVPHSEAETFHAYGNMLHSERLGTFMEVDWPNSQSCVYLCTPQKLAQAGLEYYGERAARCVVCLRIVKDLQPTSDPWICHATVNPDCQLILLGKPNKPDDYTLKQFHELACHRRINYVEMRFQEEKRRVAKRLAIVMRADWAAVDRASIVANENLKKIPTTANPSKVAEKNKYLDDISIISDSDDDV